MFDTPTDTGPLKTRRAASPPITTPHIPLGTDPFAQPAVGILPAEPVRSRELIGGVTSILAGLLFALSAALFFAFQAGRFDANSIRSISEYLAAAPAAGLVWILINWSTALGSLLAVGGVLALEERLRPVHPGLARWTAALALLGYAILAVTSVADLYQIRRLAAVFPQLDAAAQAAFEAMGPGSLDPAINLRLITFGSWFLAAGWLGLCGARLPRLLSALGILAGCLALVFAGATLFEWPALSSAAATAASLFQPLWLLLTGWVLLREEK